MVSNAVNLREVNGGNVVIKFHAPWCVPCQAFNPQYEQIISNPNYNEKFKFWDVDVSTENGSQIANSLSIKNVPSVVVFAEGMVKEMLIGHDVNLNKLTEVIESCIRMLV